MKQKIRSKKYALVVIAILFLLSAISVWCVIPKDTMKSALTVKISNVECVAQGDYTPKPLETVKLTPARDDNEMIILCTAGQGDYKPKPLDGSGD